MFNIFKRKKKGTPIPVIEFVPTNTPTEKIPKNGIVIRHNPPTYGKSTELTVEMDVFDNGILIGYLNYLTTEKTTDVFVKIKNNKGEVVDSFTATDAEYDVETEETKKGEIINYFEISLRKLILSAITTK